MIDQASFEMARGSLIACERIQGMNDNMGKSHFHKYFELYYLESGERYHILNEHLYCIHPGEVMLFHPYVMHHSYGLGDVPFKRILAYFTPEAVSSRELLNALNQGGGVYHLEARPAAGIHRMLCKLLAGQASPAEEFTVEFSISLLNLLLITILRSATPYETPEKESRITAILSYLHTHYMEDLPLERLSQQFYLSPYYLCREFKRHTNTTIVQYVNTIRVLNAQRMFLETDKNITQISKEVGFSNLTHFGRVFKSVTGMAPSQNRKLYGEGRK